MRISTYSDYSLRLLMYLGVTGDRLCTITEVTKSYEISRGHLMKIVNDLGREGYVETVRGRNGGLRLGKSPKDIRLGEVLRYTETDFNIAPCFENGEMCSISRCCILKTALKRATIGFLDTLDEYTLADLIAPSDQLRMSLSIPLN